jgi:hypothetical protein
MSEGTTARKSNKRFFMVGVVLFHYTMDIFISQYYKAALIFSASA